MALATAGVWIDAAAYSWQPFVLVTGLLVIGVVANQDGLFAWIASLLGRAPGGNLGLYAVAMLLVAAVSALLNLDTATAFLTPVLVLTARSRGAGEARFLYGCIFMSNAASLLLPGSNLTNLLVLAGEHTSGSVYLARMFFPWVAAVLVTAAGVALVFRGRNAERALVGAPAARPTLPVASLAVLVAVAAVIMVLPDSALPVLVIGLAIATVRVVQGRIAPATIWSGVGVPTLAGVFLLAVALGALARVWDGPAQLMAGAGNVGTATIAAAGSVLVDNLPAAVLLGSHLPAHPRSLLIGLNIGPNLAVTGSLSALIWWRAARGVGAHPSAIRYSAVGVVLAPLTMAAALAAEQLRL